MPVTEEPLAMATTKVFAFLSSERNKKYEKAYTSLFCRSIHCPESQERVRHSSVAPPHPLLLRAQQWLLKLLRTQLKDHG